VNVPGLASVRGWPGSRRDAGRSAGAQHLVLIGGLALAAALGALIVLAPRWGALAPLALAGAVVVWRYPKASVGASVFFVVLAGAASARAMPGVGNLIDEAVVIGAGGVIVIKRLLTQGRLRRLPGDAWFALYLVAGFASTYAHHVPARLSVQDAFLFLKGAFFAFAVCQLDWRPRDVPVMIKAGVAAIALIFLAAAVNLAMPVPWYDVVANASADRVRVRGGFTTVLGPFNHVGWFGLFMAMIAAALLTHRSLFGATRGGTAALGVSVLGTVLSLRRKAIAALLAGTAFILLSQHRSRMPTVAASIVVGAVVLLIAGDTIASILSATYATYIDEGIAPRTLIYQGGWDLMVANFPLGAGLGRYGGEVAFTHYSPIYYELGFSNVYGFRPDNPNSRFATDAFWPAIVGQAGILGLIGYAGGLLALVRASRPLRSMTEDPWTRFIGLLAAAWSIQFAMASVAQPVYSGPPGFLVLFGLLGVAAGWKRQPGAASSDGASQRRAGALRAGARPTGS
jgi:hypothetical protein